MYRKLATFIFIGICVILAILLLVGAITPLVSGIIFAIALVLLGVLSWGFRKLDFETWN
jgi:hypothetical protein